MSRSSERWARQWRNATRGIAFELSMMVIAILGLLGAVGATVAVAMRAGGDLDFGGARSETTAMLAADRAGLFAVRRVAARVGNRQVAGYDSLAVVGDTVAIAALAKGGFLRDEVDKFNDFAFRRAWNSQLTGQDDRALQSSSLLRLARTDDGAVVLNTQLNPGTLRVTAPASARETATLRTADWQSGPALLGLTGELMLAGANGSLSSAATLSHADCAVKTVQASRQLLYCGSVAGANVDRGYDMQVAMAQPKARGEMRLSEERAQRLWKNGKPVTSPVAARMGDVLYTPRTGPVTFSELARGVLADTQWVNGRVQARALHGTSLAFFARASQSLKRPANGAPVTLALDAALTAGLDRQIALFMERYGNVLESISVVVADAATGELKAIAESDQQGDEPLVAFEPVLIGSMSKPLIAAAILARQPDLAALTVERTADKVTTMAGSPLRAPMGNPGNNCPPRIAFVNFLGCSSNRYAVELLATSLQQSAGTRNIVERGGAVPRHVLESSALADGLLELFADVDVIDGRTAGRSDRLWHRDSVTDRLAPAVPRDESLHPYVSRPWFIGRKAAGTPPDLLARFAIGGWENRWTLVGALEAYLRIATDRKLQLTVLERPNGRRAAAPVMDASATHAFHQVRLGLREVAQHGTASGLDVSMSRISPTPDSMLVLAKTGTLNEDAEAIDESGVFLKALAVVAGVPEAGNTGAPLRCGFGSIIYIQFRQDWKERSHAASDAHLPDLHRRFAEEALVPQLREFWKRWRPCAAPGSSAPPTSD